MSDLTYSRMWREQVKHDLADYKEILSWDDLFENWDRNAMPQEAAANELYHGLELLYGDVDHNMAVTYLRRCIEVADRAFAEEKFSRSKRCKDAFPSNRGLAERARQYARALLGKKLDAKALRSGAEDIIAYFKTWDDPIDSQMHAYWLAAVRMTLIAGDPARALKMIQEAPSLKWHQKEADLLRDIAKAAIEARPIKDRKLLERLEKLFNKVRSPKYRGSARVFDEPELQRFELGVIRHRYFISKNESIDWDKVLESIRR